MTSTNFQDYNQNTPIVSAWLNDVNNGVYTPGGVPKKAIQSSAAWVRFTATGGVVVIQQSSNIASVVRTGLGVYVITYGAPLTQAQNSYGVSMSPAGFAVPSAETVQSVTITCTNAAGAAEDAAPLSVQIFGSN